MGLLYAKEILPGGSTWPKVVFREDILDPHFWESGGRTGSAMVAFKWVMVVSCRLSTVTTVLSLTIPPQFAIEYLLCSNEHFRVKFGEEGINYFSQILTRSRRDMSCRMQKQLCRCLLSFEHNARTWQADRQTKKTMNGNINTNRQNSFQRCRVITDNRHLLCWCVLILLDC